MYHLYLNRLNAEAREALENIRAARLQGNVKLAMEWCNWYADIEAERRTLRNMTLVDFVTYYFSVIVPAQTAA